MKASPQSSEYPVTPSYSDLGWGTTQAIPSQLVALDSFHMIRAH